MDLSGKVAVVRGAGAGIGRGVARAFAAHGARVAAVDINLETARETAAGIDAGGEKALAVQADVGEEESVDAAFAAIAAKFGQVDCLLNVAGIELYREFLDYSSADWDRQLAVNLKSVFLCSRRAVPHMQRCGGGSIGSIASVQALATTGRIAPYAAADVGRYGITGNAICPGVIQTPMLERSFTDTADRDAYIDKLKKALPLGRIGAPADIAHAALFLSSDYASYVTGVALVVDGGMMSRLPLPEAD